MWDIILKILEGVSYACTPVILVIAIMGLKQITVARENRSVESERDAVRLANENIRTFFEIILPRFEDARASTAAELAVQMFATKDTTSDKNIDLETAVDLKKVNSNYATDRNGARKITKSTLDNYLDDVRRAFNQKRSVFNLIEGFASSFTSGLADEKIAYTAMGKAFVQVVKDYAELIDYFNSSAGYYRNITVLYSLWSKRLAMEEIQKEIQDIENEHNSNKQILQKNEEQLTKMKHDIDRIELKEINLIGVAKKDKQRAIRKQS